jgi:AraC-like DNA-binding protein
MMGRDPLLGVGDGVLMWNAHAGSMMVPSAEPFVTFRVPLAAIKPHVTDVEAAVARRIPAHTEALRLLRHYLGAFKEHAAPTSPEVMHLAVSHAHDLLALAIGATRDAAHIAEGRGLRAARLQAIKEDLLANFHCPELSVNAVAARHQVTPRYVQQLFDAEGTTFTQFVREQRLAHVHRALASVRYATVPIAAIAYESGFGDLSYFNRAFQRRYGMSPSDVRAAAQSPHARPEIRAAANSGSVV